DTDGKDERDKGSNTCIVFHDLLLVLLGSGGGKFSDSIMPPERLRCKIKPANLLTREYCFLVPVNVGGRLPIADCQLPIFLRYQSFQIGNRQLAIGNLNGRAELFNKGYAVDFVQGRNSAEDLVQGRISQAL